MLNYSLSGMQIAGFNFRRVRRLWVANSPRISWALVLPWRLRHHGLRRVELNETRRVEPDESESDRWKLLSSTRVSTRPYLAGDTIRICDYLATHARLQFRTLGQAREMMGTFFVAGRVALGKRLRKLLEGKAACARTRAETAAAVALPTRGTGRKRPYHARACKKPR